jgi:hypothetical protein
MKKLLAIAAMGLTSVGISAAVAAPALASTVNYGNYIEYSKCVAEGNRILWNSPKAQTFECRVNQLGGFTLFVTY